MRFVKDKTPAFPVWTGGYVASDWSDARMILVKGAGFEPARFLRAWVTARCVQPLRHPFMSYRLGAAVAAP